jgi:hypothetical protein
MRNFQSSAWPAARLAYLSYERPLSGNHIASRHWGKPLNSVCPSSSGMPDTALAKQPELTKSASNARMMNFQPSIKSGDSRPSHWQDLAESRRFRFSSSYRAGLKIIVAVCAPPLIAIQNALAPLLAVRW